MEKCNIDTCNIYAAQKYIKHKWIPVIIFLLNKNEEMLFTELLNSIDHLSNKRLSDSLNTLTDNKIINKSIDNKYSLSNQGQELAKIITLMNNFNG